MISPQTQEQIQKIYELAPGELTLLAAEKIMRWPHVGDNEPLRPYVRHGGIIMNNVPRKFKESGGSCLSIWLPTTEIADAWELLEKIISTTKRRPLVSWVAENEWKCEMSWSTQAFASKAPLAITRASLLTLSPQEFFGEVPLNLFRKNGEKP